MTQKIEGLVSIINQGVGEASSLVDKGEIPDFTQLDSKINEFSTELSQLPPEEAKQYIELLRTWAEQIKMVSDKLEVLKDDVASQISGASTGSRAIGAYGSASNLIKPVGSNNN